MLLSERITDSSAPRYERFWNAYLASFPADERRSPAAQAAAMADPRYRLDAWTHNSRFVGFMGWWDFGSFRYIEHVAVDPVKRSGGYGGRIMHQWMEQDISPIYLEIEEVTDEITRRRLHFYLRLGFMETPMHHIQPSYQPLPSPENGSTASSPKGVALQVLSWPEVITEQDYAVFSNLLHGVVWSTLSL